MQAFKTALTSPLLTLTAVNKGAFFSDTIINIHVVFQHAMKNDCQLLAISDRGCIDLMTLLFAM